MRWGVVVIVSWILACFATRSCEGRFADILDRDLMEFLQNDYYGALGLGSGASEKDIKRAYRQLSMKHHPDRNAGADEQRFLDIRNANEVLSDPSRKRKYDQFLAECPKAWLPVYGKWKANPVSVIVGAFAGVVALVSFAQGSQFKREKRRALNSEFFAVSMEKATAAGQTEEEFRRMFLDANPELERTWKDTVGVRLITLPWRLLFSKKKQPSEDMAGEVGENQDIGDDYDESGDASSDDEEEDYEWEREESFPDLALDENASPEEKKRIEKLRRKAMRKRMELQKQRESQRLKKKEQQKKSKTRAAEKSKEMEKRAAESERLQKVENERILKVKQSGRQRRIRNELDNDACVRLLEADEENELINKLVDENVLPSGWKLDEVSTHADAIRKALGKWVDSEELGNETFWEPIFDEVFREIDEEKHEAAELEQELYEEEQRKKNRALREPSVIEEHLDTNNEQDGIDEEWARELAQQEAEKKAKKQKAKNERAKKIEANKVVNEQTKKSGGNKAGKKERRRG